MPCGRPGLALAGIDGRRDSVLILPIRDARSADRNGATAVPATAAPVAQEMVAAMPANSDGCAGTRAIFPDVLRRAMMLASGNRILDYRIAQTDGSLVIRLALAVGAGSGRPHAEDAQAEAEASVRAELGALFAQQGVAAPPIAFQPWQPEAAGDKCCRIRRVTSATSPVSSKAIA